MRAEPNPTVARRELAARLRQAREQHGFGLDDLAKALGVSGSQASRLDVGVRGYQPSDVEKLGDVYGMPDGETAALLELAGEARLRAWWQKIDLHDAYRTLIGYEQSALSIAEYGEVVPGLLQTAAYAEAIAAQGDMGRPFERSKIEQAVRVRMTRQEILRRADAPRLRVVIDEVALARGPRDRQVRRAQLEALLLAGEQPNTTIQILGFEYGLHPAVRGNFVIVSVAGATPDLIYSEGLTEPRILESADEVALYHDLWHDLQGIALDPSASRDRIESYLR